MSTTGTHDGDTAGTVAVDAAELEAKVAAMYRAVAVDPGGDFHFELGRDLAERLGYPSAHLDRVPPEAVESFAGVGYVLDLADLRAGETVVDLGSGSGMDAFVAASTVGPTGRVTGVDMTAAQLAKAERLRAGAGFHQVTFLDGHIDALPLPDDVTDAVISNGVINLAADKARVFREAARVLRPGGRLAIADIVTERPLTPQIVADSDLWASCIGGAAHIDVYRQMIADAGLDIVTTRRNDYRFLSEQARGASDRFGVHSISLLARRR